MATYSITEWKEHQHYKDRDPNWVKLYQKTLTSITWLKADLLARTIMLASLLLAARYKNAIPIDEDVLIPALAPRSTKWDSIMLALRYLEACGFLSIDDSDVLALTRSREAEDIDQKRKIPPKSPKGDEHESFPDFWKVYPSRGTAANPRKPAAKAHMAALKRGADPAELIRLAPTAAPADKHGTEFVPQATTWLNEDRWKDAPPPAPVVRAETEEDQWRRRLKGWIENPRPLPDRFWLTSDWGPAPHLPGTKVPKKLLGEFGVAEIVAEHEMEIPDFMKRQRPGEAA